MAKQRAKKHHYVPQVLQRRFNADNGKIWYAEKDKITGLFAKAEERNTSSCFMLRDYYTISEANKLSDKVETTFYGEIDSYLGDLLPNLVASLDSNSFPTFTAEAFESLKSVLYHLLTRTPDFVSTFDDIEAGQEIIEKTVSALKREGKDHDAIAEEQKLHNSSLLKKLGREARVRGQIKKPEEFTSLMSDFEVFWIKAPDKHRYILGSRIAYIIGNGGPNGISNPKSEIWFPISSRYCMVVMRPNGGINQLSRDSPKRVKALNLYIARNCSQIGGHSNELITSIANKSNKLEQA